MLRKSACRENGVVLDKWLKFVKRRVLCFWRPWGVRMARVDFGQSEARGCGALWLEELQWSPGLQHVPLRVRASIAKVKDQMWYHWSKVLQPWLGRNHWKVCPRCLLCAPLPLCRGLEWPGHQVGCSSTKRCPTIWLGTLQESPGIHWAELSLQVGDGTCWAGEFYHPRFPERDP